MSEKFDFSKIEDQQKFESLPQEEKDKIVGEAQEEAKEEVKIENLKKESELKLWPELRTPSERVEFSKMEFIKRFCEGIPIPTDIIEAVESELSESDLADYKQWRLSPEVEDVIRTSLPDKSFQNLGLETWNEYTTVQQNYLRNYNQWQDYLAILREWKSAGTLENSKIFLSKYRDVFHGQLGGLIFLSCLIRELNKDGVRPRLLEHSAGRDFGEKGGGDTTFGAPFCSKILGRLAKKGTLDIDQIVIVDPTLFLEEYEKKFFNITAHGCFLATQPRVPLPSGEKFNLGSNEFKIIAKRTKIEPPISSQELKALKTHGDFEAFHFYLYLRQRKEGAIQDFKTAKEIADASPFDIVYAFTPQLSTSEFIPLLKNGGFIWSDMSFDGILEGKKVIYNTE